MSSETPKLPADWRTALSRAPREPLLQFLVIGLVLFGVNSLLHGGDNAEAPDAITISEGRVQQIAESYRAMSGRLPNRTELDTLVDDFIDEEIAYREATAMGLDLGDTIVRRRMRQKLTFLAEDVAASKEPDETALRQYLADHREDYRIPARIGFRQVMVNSDNRGETAQTDAEDILRQLNAGADPAALGDPSMLPKALPLSNEDNIALMFGPSFAASVVDHAGEGWFGPVKSPIGLHVVEITRREPARDPSFEEVRSRLESDWIEARRAEAREAFEKNLRARYDVTVEWPETYSGEPQPSGGSAASSAGGE